MALTNPTKYVSVQRLQRFETKLAAKYQTQAISAITGLNAETVEAALAELLGKIQALPSSIVPKGTKAFAGLDPTTDLVAANVGFMYNISDAFTTTADFVEGAGHSIPAGANVYIANPSTGVYKYDIFAGMYDLSGYALKSEMSITDVSGDATKKNIQLKSGLSQDVLVAHQDISGKADKVASATSGNIAKLDANGNLVDAGIAASDVAVIDSDAVEGNFAAFDGNGNPVDSGHKHSDYKTKQTAVADSDATTSGNDTTFVDSVTQDANGEITVHKKTVPNVAASTSGTGGTNGLMLATDKEKLDNLLECSDNDIDEIFD
ncbi:MAG: hypothetical protein K6F74_05670 [Prevotella sp.]|nr:hypothetical protein [Prevotella sp.]